jgi:carbon-monoxide dehydrogenase large subunit
MSEDSLAWRADVMRPRHVGAPIKRTEDPRLLTGRGEYAADRKPDRALHIAFRRSEQPHARIVRIDTSAAQTAQGVVAVFTAKDVAEDFKPVIPFSRMANYYATPILPLASGKVRYVGEAIIAVIATSRYLAKMRSSSSRSSSSRSGRCRTANRRLHRVLRCCTKRPERTC